MINFRYQSADLYVAHQLTPQPIPENFRMHTHAYTELFCFLSGNAIFHVEGTEYKLQPGDILLMRPAEAHYIQVDPNVPYERISINFDAQILISIDPENTLLAPLFHRTAGTQNHYRPDDSVCLNLLLQMTNPVTHQRINILGNLILLLQKLSEMFYQGQQVDVREESLENRIINYINRNLDRELTLQTLCKRFFVSRTQFCRRFRLATGTSAGNYITTKRMHLAKQLLQNNQQPYEVSVACGYQDYSSFYRAYVKHFGHSPKSECLTSNPLLAEETDIIF